MDWELISVFSQIVGAIAMIGTMGYLAIQIRDNSRIARSVARQNIAQMTFLLVENNELAETIVKDLSDEELTAVETVRIQARSYVLMRNWENIHSQFLSKMISKDEWQGFRLNLKAILEWKSMQIYWSNESQFYSTVFRDEVAAILNELDPSKRRNHDFVLKTTKDSSN